MTIAVTAASGQLGNAIVKALKALTGDAKIIAIARTPQRAAELGVEVRRGDYGDRASLDDALTGVDTLLLVSGMDAPEKRIEAHRNVIDAAAAAGVRKLVYTSIQGPEADAGFSPIVKSNRQTESDVRDSGLAWVIGRNGIYIEPDVDYIDSYRRVGEIANCAGDGKCGYTTRPELAYAYARMLTDAAHDGRTYNLHGQALTQQALADHLSKAFGIELGYRAIGVEAFRQDRIAELGEFIGGVIAGIYQGISQGAFDNPSDFTAATGRPHQTWDDYFARLKADHTARGGS